MDKNALRKLIMDDLKQYQKNFSLHMGQEIADALTEEAHNAIRDFYASYHPNPESYVRHYNFWKSYQRIHTNNNGRRLAGVKLLIDELPDVYNGRESSPQDVFYRVYLGAHGIASYQGKIPFMSPTPFTRLYKKRKEIVENYDYYVKRAYEKAKKDKYKIIKV